MALYNEQDLGKFRRWAEAKVAHRFGTELEVIALELPRVIRDEQRAERYHVRGALLPSQKETHPLGQIFSDSDCDDPLVREAHLQVEQRDLTISWLEAGEHDWIDLADPLGKYAAMEDGMFPRSELEFISGNRLVQTREELLALPVSPARTPGPNVSGSRRTGREMA